MNEQSTNSQTDEYSLNMCIALIISKTHMEMDKTLFKFSELLRFSTINKHI